MLAVLEFEHKTASVVPFETLPMKWAGKPATFAPVDDDWYYEMAAVRVFEKHGVGLTVEQLVQPWAENRCGSWDSSEQARFNLAKGLKGGDLGHPRYHKLWFTLGPQFSRDRYGALAPGLPNAAGRMARTFGHINGCAEGTDGTVFTAVAISLGFTTQDLKTVIREAVKILHPSSPYRQSIEQVIALADSGTSSSEI